MGRVLVSVAIVAVLGGVLTWNLPQSELARRTQPVFQRFMFATGLDQNWSVFAPDPPQVAARFEARIQYADGTERIWRVPGGGDLVGPYWDYRWLKWAELITAGNDARAWDPAARWIASQERAAGRRPVKVVLRRSLTTLPLGSAKGESSFVDFYLHEVEPVAPETPA